MDAGIAVISSSSNGGSSVSSCEGVGYGVPDEAMCMGMATRLSVPVLFVEKGETAGEWGMSTPVGCVHNHPTDELTWNGGPSNAALSDNASLICVLQRNPACAPPRRRARGGLHR